MILRWPMKAFASSKKLIFFITLKIGKLCFYSLPSSLTLLHSEQPKLYGVGHSECIRVKQKSASEFACSAVENEKFH